jgi:hypothetical protein
MVAQGLKSLRWSEHFRRPNRRRAQQVQKASRRGVVQTIGCSIEPTAYESSNKWIIARPWHQNLSERPGLGSTRRTKIWPELTFTLTHSMPL